MANGIQGQVQSPSQAVSPQVGQTMMQPNANAQPSEKKSIFKRWWFWLIVAVVLIVGGYLIWQLI